jgi:alcohol dehydrogenase (cytochrome c)
MVKVPMGPRKEINPHYNNIREEKEMTQIKKYSVLVFAGILTLLMLTAACSSKSATTTTTTTNTTTATSTASSATFQTLSASGQGVFSASCAGCHGANGQGGAGPALWGSGATLGTYKGNTIFNSNAQDMLTFVSTKMPLSAPGSLTHQQYIEVLSNILVQGNQVSGSTTFNESQLSSITLK